MPHEMRESCEPPHTLRVFLSLTGPCGCTDTRRVPRCPRGLMKPRHNFLAEKLQCGHDLAVRNKAAAIEFREDAVYAELDLCIQAMIEEVRFAEDSPLEGDGFELPVPREMTTIFEPSCFWFL